MLNDDGMGFARLHGLQLHCYIAYNTHTVNGAVESGVPPFRAKISLQCSCDRVLRFDAYKLSTDYRPCI